MGKSGILLLSIVFAASVGYSQGTADTAQVLQKPKSAFVAGLSSAVVPGLGKLYLGYPHQALSSFSMNLALCAATTELFIKGAPPVMQYTALGIASVFYIGNIWGSVALAKKREIDFQQQLQWEQEPQDLTPPPDTNAALPGTPYEQALASFLDGDYNRTYNLLCLLPDTARLQNHDILRLWLLCLNETGKWDSCRDLLIRMCDTIPAHKAEAEALPIDYPVKSPEKARLRSGWLPGLGQCYAGYPGKGAISFLLNAGFAVATGLLAASGLYITGVVYGLYPLLRFYKGGRILSYKLANQKNEETKALHNKQYRDLIFVLLP